MPAPIKLKIITPERLVLEQQVDSVIAQGSEGEFEILPQHEPIIAALKIDVLRYRTGRDENSAAVIGGVLEAHNDEITVLSDVAELDTEIDIARANQAKMRAEAEKTQRTDKIEIYVSEMAIARAMARLKAADLRQRRHKPHGG